MTDRELEARLRTFYRTEVDEGETAPPALRRVVAAIPRTIPRAARSFGRGRPLTLLAAAALLLVGGAVAATGSGLVRLPSLLPPEPAPTLPVAVTTRRPSRRRPRQLPRPRRQRPTRGSRPSPASSTTRATSASARRP